MKAIEQDELFETFGERFKNVLIDQKYTIRSFMDENLSDSAIRSYVSCRRIPNAATIHYICRKLNVSADYLLGLSSIKELPRGWVVQNGKYYCPYCDTEGASWYSYCPICGKAISIDI